MYTLKPIDSEAIRQVVVGNKFIFTAEEHNIIGAIGSTIAEFNVDEGSNTRYSRIGTNHEFVYIATYSTILERCGFGPNGIYKKVINSLKKRKSLGGMK